MRKTPIIVIVATLMVFSAFAVAFEASATSYHNGPQATPQVSHGATEFGNVYIYANGTVSNTSAVKQVGSTNTYDLLVNINGTLFVNRSNADVNGNGMAVSQSGASAPAVASLNTTGIVLENITIGSPSYYGVELANVTDSIVKNISTVNFSGYAAVDIFYSSNVTVENGNFSFRTSSVAAHYGIYANQVMAINVKNNNFTGPVSSDFISCSYCGANTISDNSIMSASNHGFGINIEYSGNSVVTNNKINATRSGIYWYETGAAVSTHNIVTNTTNYGFYAEEFSSYISQYDKAFFSNTPVEVGDVGQVSIQNGNFSSFTSAFYVYDYGSLSITNSYLSAVSGYYTLETNAGGPLNLQNDSILYLGSGTSRYAVYTEYVSGWLNIANVSVTASNNFGLYLYGDPFLNITHSHFDAKYGIYVEYSTLYSTTIAHNTLLVSGGGYGIYMDSGNIYNVDVSNNTVITASSSWSEYGIDVYVYYTSSNLTVSNNFIQNSTYAIYLYADDYGKNARVLNNTILNSKYAIVDYYYFDIAISRNVITNVSYTGILVQTDGPGGMIVSSNTVQNMPGFGQMTYGLSISDLYSGVNTVYNNTVINAGSGAYGIYIYTVYGGELTLYSNTVTNSYAGLLIEDTLNVSYFGNVVSTAQYGIYSEYNANNSYYSNTIDNASYSLYSLRDVGVQVFANTFHDAQVNDSSLYFLELSLYSGLVLYHNNFINSTTNSTVKNEVYAPSGPLYMYKALPVGGNYYSNYSGTGSNGIGSTPMNVSGSVKDLYPLLNEWSSPTVTFLETGLSSGTTWSVKLGSSTQTASGSSVVFQQTNGQYMTESYSIQGVPGYTASVTAGSLSLSGSSNVVTVSFSPVKYSVKITETGLASGTSWSATLNGQTKTSTTQDITFSVANGTYSYTVGSVHGYTSTGSPGTVDVSGNSQAATVQFSAISYTLTVNETGLPSGDSWSVTVAGHTYNTTSDSMTLQLVSGKYNITVTGPSGYKVSLQSSNVTVNNGNATLNALFSGSKSSGAGSGTIYLGIGIGAAAGGIAGVLGTMFSTGTGIFRRPGE